MPYNIFYKIGSWCHVAQTWHDVGTVQVDQALIPGVREGKPHSCTAPVGEGVVKGLHVKD